MNNTNTNAAISNKIMALVAGGMNVIDAIKTVCGAERINQMIEDLYNELRSK